MALNFAGASLRALTGARFFAALLVVFYHYGRGSLAAVAPWLSDCAAAGPAAVSFFYVLSGTVLTWGCTDADGAPSRPAPRFWVQRGARILPAYVLALGLSVVPFAIAAWRLHPGGGGMVRVAAGIAGSLLLVQAFWPPLAVGLNTPGWSISCEAFFYLLWPSLVVRVRTARPGFPWRVGLSLWAASVAAPLLGIAAIRAGWVPPGPFATLTVDESGRELLARTLSYFPPLRLPEFVFGIALGHALRRTPPRERSTAIDTVREFTLLGGLLAFAWVLGSGQLGRLSGIQVTDRIVAEGGAAAPLFALLVWQLARGRGLLQRLLSITTLHSLGDASYALYILQEPIMVWTTGLLKRIAPRLILHWDVVFWVYAALLVAFSVIVHRVIELPWRTRLAARLTSPAP